VRFLLVDVLDRARDQRVGCVFCPVVEVESVGARQELHVLGERGLRS